jgi:hypothetical protein
MIDIVTIGTGGGSIAWQTPESGLKVGPRSAGAHPGPLSYGQGGTEPTVTDAHLLLGHLPDVLLGGEMPLDVEAARAGLTTLAKSLDMSLEDCAAGVLEIAVWNQANAIRQMTVKRGLDVRDFTLTTFGGSGPLQVCRLMDLLGLKAALVPANPGNLSAFGLLTVDVRNDYVQTFVRDQDVALADIAATYDQLERRAAEALHREAFDHADQRLLRQADLRYAGQAFEVRVDAPAGPIDEGFRAAVISRFHDAHEATYGYCYRDDPRQRIEWVNLRASGIGPIPKPELRRTVARAGGDQARARTGEREVRFDGTWHVTPLFARDLLQAGDEITGPAVVEEFGSTVPLAPGFSARIDDLGDLVVAMEGNHFHVVVRDLAGASNSGTSPARTVRSSEPGGRHHRRSPADTPTAVAICEEPDVGESDDGDPGRRPSADDRAVMPTSRKAGENSCASVTATQHSAAAAGTGRTGRTASRAPPMITPSGVASCTGAATAPKTRPRSGPGVRSPTATPSNGLIRPDATPTSSDPASRTGSAGSVARRATPAVCPATLTTRSVRRPMRSSSTAYPVDPSAAPPP